MSPDDVEPLEETIDVLSQPVALRDIDESEAAMTTGDLVSSEDLRARYLRE